MSLRIIAKTINLPHLRSPAIRLYQLVHLFNASGSITRITGSRNNSIDTLQATHYVCIIEGFHVVLRSPTAVQ